MRAKAVILAAGLLSAVAATAAATDAAFHFALSRSVPAADASVASPDEVRLWFSQVAQPGSVAIRLIAPGGDAVRTSDPIRDEDDGRIYHVDVATRLPAGAYTVSWRGIGDDGHVVRGDFRFSVTTE
jgi:copper resistance protein C